IMLTGVFIGRRVPMVAMYWQQYPLMMKSAVRLRHASNASVASDVCTMGILAVLIANMRAAVTLEAMLVTTEWLWDELIICYSRTDKREGSPYERHPLGGVIFHSCSPSISLRWAMRAKLFFQAVKKKMESSA